MSYITALKERAERGDKITKHEFEQIEAHEKIEMKTYKEWKEG